ncbi:MAG: hypothetical protein RL660_1934 [Bacteroidota bacterium]|jgi:outer membrane lipoprotein-sorting protein
MLTRLFVALTLVVASTSTILAQNPKKIIQTVNAKFAKVSSYTADGNVKFDIPSVKLSPINVSVYFKKPSKFKMHSRGLFFMPKQNPMGDIAKLLSDTSSYTAVHMGKETVNGKSCHIVNILPTKNMGDFIVGKFWINDAEGLVYKSEITTKNAGTVLTESFYGAMASYGLPDKVILTMDVNKFKIPKMLAMDINRKKATTPSDPNKKEISKITVSMKNYKVNVAIDDKIFQ